MIRQLTPPVATETLPVRPSTSERDENTQSPSRSQLKPGEVTTGTDAAVDSPYTSSNTSQKPSLRTVLDTQFEIEQDDTRKVPAQPQGLASNVSTTLLSQVFGNCSKHRGLEVGRERVTPPRRHYSHMARRQCGLA